MKTVILGAGPAGLSAAYHLNGETLLVEKESRVGGLARSIEKEGFIFDYAGHIIFTRDTYIESLVPKLLGDNIHYQHRDAWIYSQNTYTRYPFQSNTFGLPREVILDCVLGVIDAAGNHPGVQPAHFEEWITHTFGKGIARHFMVPYNKKVWAFPLSDMTHEWIADRVMTPDIREVLEGALESRRGDYGPNSRFCYPLRGGSQAFMDSFLPHLNKTDLRLDSEVLSIDTGRKRVTVQGGEEIAYDVMISTLPLPELVPLCGDAPADVIRAAKKMIYTSVYCLNVAIDHPGITEKNWIYYPEEDVVFQRLFIQSNASPHAAPPGKSSLTAEISYSSHKPLAREGIRERVVNDLLKTGFITSRDQVDFTFPLDVTYGYVIFEKERQAKVNRIREFLRSHNIITAGRFGEWEYYNMDHAILSGKRAAEQVESILQGSGGSCQ